MYLTSYIKYLHNQQPASINITDCIGTHILRIDMALTRKGTNLTINPEKKHYLFNTILSLLLIILWRNLD